MLLFYTCVVMSGYLSKVWIWSTCEPLWPCSSDPSSCRCCSPLLFEPFSRNSRDDCVSKSQHIGNLRNNVPTKTLSHSWTEVDLELCHICQDTVHWVPVISLAEKLCALNNLMQLQVMYVHLSIDECFLFFFSYLNFTFMIISVCFKTAPLCTTFSIFRHLNFSSISKLSPC